MIFDQRRKYSQVLNFLPGFIILMFGALALYSSLLMVELVSDLREFVPKHLNGSSFSKEVNQKELWLYFSIIMVSVSGFVLVVLNSTKLVHLKQINDEKDKIVETLESRLSALEVAQEGIFIVDSNGLMSYMNKSLFIINGLNLSDRDRYIGKDWLSIFSSSDRESLEENILADFNRTGCWIGDFSMYRPDNSVIHVDFSITILPDGGLIGSIQDVSERYDAEKKKKEMEEQFYQAQKMEAIGRLAGGIAHDFNNILAAMNGYAEFLKDDLEENTQQHEFADNILKAGLQARSLVDQMLAFSRTRERECESLDLIVPVSEAMTMLKATLSENIELHSNFLIPYAPIVGSPTQMSQLVMNLCVNAMDAMEGKKGEINVTIEKVIAEDSGHDEYIRDDLPNPKETPSFRIIDGDSGQTKLFLGHMATDQYYVKLSVCDTGMGMSRIIMEHIFEPFFTTKSVDKGTGLGLATVHGIVVSHQGFLVIDTVLGKGTRFDLFFPLSENVSNVEVEKKKETNTGKVKSSAQKHILLIEDQENVRLMVLELLRRMGYKTSYAVSGLDGLDIIRENPESFDLVITDYNMPKMTGLEMIEQIYLDLPDLPFILLSGYSEDRMRDIINDHKAIKAIVRKPVSREVISAKISAILGKDT